MAHDHDNLTDGPLPGDIEDPRSLPTWMYTGMSVALMIVVVFAVSAMYYGAVFRDNNSKLISVRSQAAQVMREARTMATMQEPHWETYTDEDGELVGEKTLKIPVDQAALIIIERYGSKGGDQK